MISPFQVVKDFEAALCEYTGARYAVTTTSCTMALLLACSWFKLRHGPQHVSLPRYTYVGVPMSVLHAGHMLMWRTEDWEGEYKLSPLPLWDSARRLRRGMYRPGEMQCLSFHWSKHLGIQQGGAILHDDQMADRWLRLARFDGRSEDVAPSEDAISVLGWHAYMSPETAAAGLVRMAFIPDMNPDLPKSQYPDCSRLPVFSVTDLRCVS